MSVTDKELVSIRLIFAISQLRCETVRSTVLATLLASQNGSKS